MAAAKRSAADVKPTAFRRWVLFDLYRSFHFIAVIFFHMSWFFWRDGAPHPSAPVVALSAQWAWAGAFGGFALLLLSTLLLGWRGSLEGRLRWLFAFGAVGTLLFMAVVAWRDGLSPRLAWDIYPLLIVGFGISVPLARQRWGPAALIAGGAALLAFPFWTLQDWVPAPLRSVLTGSCPGDSSDWPLLPWVGLIALGYGLGAELRRRRVVALPWHPRELIVWGPVAILFASHAGYYFHIPIFDSWSCANFRPPIATWWAHLLFHLMILRLGLIPGVDRTLQVLAPLRHLSLNRRFYWVYLWHFLAIGGVVGWFQAAVLNAGPWLWNLMPIACLLASELIPRVTWRAFSACGRRGPSCASAE